MPKVIQVALNVFFARFVPGISLSMFSKKHFNELLWIHFTEIHYFIC